MQTQNIHDIDEEMSHLCVATDEVYRLEGGWVRAEVCVETEDAYVPSQFQDINSSF
jgi:hypothetical protein